MSQIQLRWRDANGHDHQIDVHEKAFVGRTCAGVDPQRAVVLMDPNVSRDHLVLVEDGGGLVLKDMSRNGTWVNDVRVTQGGERPLADGDVIRVGSTELTVSIERAEEDDEPNLDDTMTSWTTVSPVFQFVTNLVADVRGFTTLSESLSSDKMYDVMNAVIRTFSEIVVANHGTIKDYAGDAVYAFWEHGLMPNREKAQHAVRAALAQLDAVPKIAAGLEATIPEASALRLGWGITTGQVTVSQYGARSADLAVLGDSTNLAFRLSGLANKEISAPIVVCDQTRALVHPQFAITPLGEHMIKGKKEGVTLYGITR